MSDLKRSPPPKTRSGEMPAVKTFQETIASFNDETVPKMDIAADRMGELLRKVSGPPTSTEPRDTPIPKAPRSPFFTDEEDPTDPEILKPGDQEDP